MSFKCLQKSLPRDAVFPNNSARQRIHGVKQVVYDVDRLGRHQSLPDEHVPEQSKKHRRAWDIGLAVVIPNKVSARVTANAATTRHLGEQNNNGITSLAIFVRDHAG